MVIQSFNDSYDELMYSIVVTKTGDTCFVSMPPAEIESSDTH